MYFENINLLNNVIYNRDSGFKIQILECNKD